ncbi:hypothetical protein [Microvirga lenta]|uniref:hypothetical protein n=1 Tax=Microvirga lenta TaxID=2881337 RepID=UPI001CFFD78D|nr:hypothetical protein [Microvirga lenta]MCB5175516.1 hypothetical protein [Microvirga lenta]
MRFAAIFVGLLSLIASAASAQELTEAQKRRIHLPYIRAATDCFARTISANTAALDMAREGKWYDALAAAGNLCEAAVHKMISAHDQIYGVGTGSVFFKGPYLDDLPRAVGTRLKDALARRTAELAQAQALGRQQIDEASRTRDLLRDRMYACTKKELEGLVASSETAEILATAAMTICNREVQAALDAAMALVRLEGGNGTGLREELRGVIQRNVVTSAVQVRAASRASAPAASPASQDRAARLGGIATPEECLRTASSIREGKLVDQEKLISLMLDVCRPEIENAARAKFLEDPAQELASLRAKALENAVQAAKEIINAQ